MFSNAFQSGFISIFYSIGSNPLMLWDKAVKNGHIRRVIDDEVKSLVLEISGTNVATTYITCPIRPRASLGVRLPFLVMVVKNMKKYFTFEIQIIDDKDMRRRFRVSNFQSTTKVRPFCTTMPIGLSTGWNQIQFNLADFTRRAYGTVYIETVRVQIHANVRIRRIYFSDRLYSEEELPSEYKLFLPIGGKGKEKAADKTKGKPTKAAAEKPPPSEEIKEELEIPSGAPPSPIESPKSPKDEEQMADSVEAAAGDVADIEEVIEKTEEAEGVEDEEQEEGAAPPEPVEGAEGEDAASATVDEVQTEAEPAETGAPPPSEI